MTKHNLSASRLWFLMPFNGNQTINRQRLGFTIKRKCGSSYSVCWNCNIGYFIWLLMVGAKFSHFYIQKNMHLNSIAKEKQNLIWIKALLNNVLHWLGKKIQSYTCRIFLFEHRPNTHFWIKPFKKNYLSNITIIFVHSNLTANGARLLSAIWYG